VRAFLQVTRAVLRRDLSAEWRQKDVLTTVIMFGLLTVVTFVFAFDPARHAREDVVPGCLWTAYLFAGMLGLGRSAARDAQDGGTIGLLLSPADRGAIYLGKFLSHTVFMVAGEAVVLLFSIVWFDLDQRHLTPWFFLVLFLGTLGFVAVGTVFSVISQKSRLREVMLPVLLLPVLAPMVMAAVEATALILTPGGNEGLGSWLKLLVGFDLIFAVAGFLLYGFVLEE
jgi:heme exporter protein B